MLVALSGGADSVALLAVLTRLGYECVAAHCNFHLRGAESMRDMNHARAIADRFGAKIHTRDFDVTKRRQQTGESVEMACRELRYAWFDDLINHDRLQAVAVGHHREDNVETFFINLLRSTGLAGLTGMSYQRGNVVRPLLDCTRTDIESYLADLNVEFVTDSTNAANDFDRNRLRNVLLPQLEAAFPGAMNAVLTTMSHLGDDSALVDYAVTAAMAKARRTDGRIDIAALTADAGASKARTLLFHALKAKGFNATQVDDIVDATIAGRSGRRFESANHVAELDRGLLTVRPTTADKTAADNSEVHVTLTRDILSPVHIAVTQHHINEFNPQRNPATAYFDTAVLNGNPQLTIRPARKGDRIRPYGMTGEKLLSDLFRDAHLTAAQKRDIRVLTRNDRILWVIGLRASSLFAVTPDTRQYIQLRIIN